MADYEVVREIFNSCSGNQMRDVFFEEASINDVDAYMEQFRIGKEVIEERSVSPDGATVFDLVTDGLKQRVTFTEV